LRERDRVVVEQVRGIPGRVPLVVLLAVVL